MKTSHYEINVGYYTQNYGPWFKNPRGGISWKICL